MQLVFSGAANKYGASIQIQPAQQVISFIDKVVTVRNPFYNAIEDKISDVDLLVFIRHPVFQMMSWLMKWMTHL